MGVEEGSKETSVDVAPQHQVPLASSNGEENLAKYCASEDKNQPVKDNEEGMDGPPVDKQDGSTDVPVAQVAPQPPQTPVEEGSKETSLHVAPQHQVHVASSKGEENRAKYCASG